MPTAYINFQGLFRILQPQSVVNSYGERVISYVDAFAGSPILATIPAYAMATPTQVAAADDYYGGVYGMATYAGLTPPSASAVWFLGNVQPLVTDSPIRHLLHTEGATHAIYTRWGVPIPDNALVITVDPVCGADMYQCSTSLMFLRSTQLVLKRTAVPWAVVS